MGYDGLAVSKEGVGYDGLAVRKGWGMMGWL